MHCGAGARKPEATVLWLGWRDSVYLCIVHILITYQSTIQLAHLQAVLANCEVQKYCMDSTVEACQISLPVGSSSSTLPVVLSEAVKHHHHVRHKPLRKIASVEGLTEEEVETITRLLVSGERCWGRISPEPGIMWH